MDKKQWKTRIKKACIQAGTYKPFFDHIIDTLADILEKRDHANEQFLASGNNPVISHTNKAGATNLVKNPLLQAVNELNASALNYWRELGLTPAGLRKIDESALKDQKKDAFADALSKIIG